MALPRLNTETYKLKVPSTGKTIEYRPFIVKDQKVLLIAKESEDQDMLIRTTKQLIRNCTFDKVDIDKLTMFDIEYIFLKLREVSVGPTTDVNIKCSNCGHKNEVVLNLANMKVTEPKIEKKISLSDNVGVVLKYPTIADAESISSKSQDPVEMILACIDTIYDKESVYDPSDYTKEELVDFVDSLSTKQLEKLGEFVNNQPKTILPIDFKCMKCGHGNHLDVEGLQGFF